MDSIKDFYEEVEYAVENCEITLEEASDLILLYNESVYDLYMEGIAYDASKKYLEGNDKSVKVIKDLAPDINKDISDIKSLMDKFKDSKSDDDLSDIMSKVNSVSEKIKTYAQSKIRGEKKEIVDINKGRRAALNNWGKQLDSFRDDIKYIRNAVHKDGSFKSHRTEDALNNASNRAKRHSEFLKYKGSTSDKDITPEEKQIKIIDAVDKKISAITAVATTAVGTITGLLTKDLALAGGAAATVPLATGATNNNLGKLTYPVRKNAEEKNKTREETDNPKLTAKEKLESLKTKVAKAIVHRGDKKAKEKEAKERQKAFNRSSKRSLTLASESSLDDELNELRLSVYEAVDLGYITEAMRDEFLTMLNPDNYNASYE